VTALTIPTPDSLLSHRTILRARTPHEATWYMHTTSSSREPDHAVDSIVLHMFTYPHLNGYAYSGLNAKAAQRVEAAFKRAGWRCTRFAPKSETPNRIVVEWPDTAVQNDR